MSPNVQVLATTAATVLGRFVADTERALSALEADDILGLMKALESREAVRRELDRVAIDLVAHYGRSAPAQQRELDALFASLARAGARAASVDARLVQRATQARDALQSEIRRIPGAPALAAYASAADSDARVNVVL